MSGEYSSIGEGYANTIGSGFLAAIEEVFKGMSGGLAQKLSILNGAMNGYSVSGGSVVNTTYSPTIIANGVDMTPSQAVAVGSRQYLVDKMRGLI